MTDERDCAHGHLARTCELCERDELEAECAEVMRARDSALATCEVIAIERDKAVRRMIQLEAGAGLLREALEGVLPLTEDHDRVCATRRQMPDCDCGWTVTAERDSTLIAARNALSTSAGTRAAAVLKAARALVAGMPYTMGAPGDGEHNALRDAIDALDGGRDGC